MLKLTQKYVDFDGNEREEDFYFNLTQAEVVRHNYLQKGGLTKLFEQIAKSQDTAQMINMFTKLIDLSYGEKSLDGREFNKSPEILKKFKATSAYSDIYMSLCSSNQKALDFIIGVLPAEMTKGLPKEADKVLALAKEKIQ